MIRFEVLGEPRPKGSKRAFTRPGGKVAMVEQGGDALKTWRGRLVEAVANNAPAAGPWTDAVAVVVKFRMPAPKVVRTPWPMAMNKGDVDKMARTLLDELTGVILADDSQVVFLVALKVYGTPGAEISVIPSEEFHTGHLGYAMDLANALVREQMPIGRRKVS